MKNNRLLPLIALIFACTPAQRSKIYVDVSAGGTQDVEATVVSSGVSYPAAWDVWATAGVWAGPYGWGPYWGLSYSFAPFGEAE